LYPIAILSPPVVFSHKESVQNAILRCHVVLLNSTVEPIAKLIHPVVFLYNALEPIATLSCPAVFKNKQLAQNAKLEYQ
jgi:hypothetical protein